MNYTAAEIIEQIRRNDSRELTVSDVVERFLLNLYKDMLDSYGERRWYIDEIFDEDVFKILCETLKSRGFYLTYKYDGPQYIIVVNLTPPMKLVTTQNKTQTQKVKALG